jgi:hypothetical protein
MRHGIAILGITSLLLTLLLGCGRPEEPAKAQQPAAQPQATPFKQEAAQKETAKLQVYDEPGMAIRTEYPDTMEVKATGSGEGSGFFFTFKPRGNALDKAEVHIFLPRGAATAAAQEPFVTGPKGLLENNGWKKGSETRGSSMFPLGWIRKTIDFSDPKNTGMAGKILLGETSGQAVQVTLYYPRDQDKEFLANAKVILEKLNFKSDKLPIGRAP